MDFLIVLLITVAIVFIFLLILLANSRSSYNFYRKEHILTIVHPLKNDQINLETELKSWNVQGFKRLWWGSIFSVNLELNSGKWQKIYSKSLSGKIDQLIIYLESSAPNRKTESFR